MRAPSGIKAQQIVNQALEAPGAQACRSCWFREVSVAEGAVLLWHKAIPLERRKALTTRRAAVTQSAAMAKAGHAGCQGPAPPEIGHLVFPQAGGTELQPTGLRRRCPCILRPGPQPQAQGREWTVGQTKTVDLVGADRRMVEQQATNRIRQMPVKLRRPCLAGHPEHRSKIARRHTIGMCKPMQPA